MLRNHRDSRCNETRASVSCLLIGMQAALTWSAQYGFISVVHLNRYRFAYARGRRERERKEAKREQQIWLRIVDERS